jgi:hypothetical protein
VHEDFLVARTVDGEDDEGKLRKPAQGVEGMNPGSPPLLTSYSGGVFDKRIRLGRAEKRG